jgi:hypothetical protein
MCSTCVPGRLPVPRADPRQALGEISRHKQGGAEGPSVHHLKRCAKGMLQVRALDSARLLLAQAAAGLLQAGHLWEGGNAHVMVGPRLGRAGR